MPNKQVDEKWVVNGEAKLCFICHLLNWTFCRTSNFTLLGYKDGAGVVFAGWLLWLSVCLLVHAITSVYGIRLCHLESGSTKRIMQNR